MTQARYLVTGGAGFIGSSIAETLRKNGERVRVIDDFSTGHRHNLEGLDVELFEGDVCDLDLLKKAMTGVEVVFHQAARASVPRSVEFPLQSDRANTHGSLSVLEIARQSGVKRVVYAGSSSAYGDTPTLPKREDMTPQPLSPYAVAKLAAEHYCTVYAHLHGLETLTTRYFNVFGARQDPNGAYAAVIPKWIASALAGEALVINGDGKQTRDFCYIDNVVHANLLAATTSKKLKGEVVNISCGERITLLELADAIAAESGKDCKRVHGPPRVGDVRDSLGDISRAKDVIGYEPKVLWREGLKRTIEAHQARPQQAKAAAKGKAT
jgi:UDP-glucose 4-epimerase